MTTIAEKLLLLNSTKSNIKSAIEAKGVTVGSVPFADYPSKISEISGGGSSAGWTRPADWLTLPTVTATDQKFVGLHAIWPDANFLALSASNAYTVDWGDGTSANYAAGVVAEKEYNYATYDTVNTTLCSRGYKQVIVTVTPQAGQTLTALNLHQRHSSQAVSYCSGFLDIALAGDSLADLRIGVQTPATSTRTINFNALERVNIARSDLRAVDLLLSNSRRLQSVVDLATSTKSASTLNVTFTDAGDLVNATAHGLRNGDPVVLTSLTSTTGITVGTRYFVISSTANAFQLSVTYGGAAVALTTNGSGVFSAGTSMSNMFNNCSSLQTVPLFNTAAVLNMTSMFGSCQSLQTVPLFNTAAVTTMANMFTNCSSLQTVPLFNTASVTSMGGMFGSCQSLQTVPLFNTAAVTNTSGMFDNCPSLQTVPLFNTAAVTNMTAMLSNCSSLSNIDMTGMKVSFSVASCKLSADRLNEIYTNLATVAGQTITVTGNYGTTSDNPSIATAKGWTVTG